MENSKLRTIKWNKKLHHEHRNKFRIIRKKDIGIKQFVATIKLNNSSSTLLKKIVKNEWTKTWKDFIP